MLFQPQLTGIATESTDCGVRATSMSVDWATKGVKRPPVKVIRTRMGKPAGPTNPDDWARAIESFDTAPELDGEYERLTGTKLTAGSPARVAEHLRKGYGAILAVDYGLYRRLMPRKSGSLTFDGLHAIFFRGLRDGKTTSWDALLDGRYRGCPKGPVVVPWDKVVKAAEKVGSAVAGHASVYAYLVDPATKLGGGVDPEPPEEPVTLASILAELYELLDGGARVQGVIDDLEALIGPYTGDADPDADPDSGVSP